MINGKYKQLEFEFYKQERWENVSWLEKVCRKIIGVKSQEEIDSLYSLPHLTKAIEEMRV